MRIIFREYKYLFFVLLAVLLLLNCKTLPPSEPTMTFEEIVNKFLSEDNIRILTGKRVVIYTSDDSVSKDFLTMFQNELRKKQIAEIVHADQNIVQLEIDRQKPDIISESEFRNIGTQSGADIIIKLILNRIPDSTKIKVFMTSAYLDRNTLAVSSEIVRTVIPSHYNIMLLPMERVDARDEIKSSTMVFLQNLNLDEEIPAGLEPIVSGGTVTIKRYRGNATSLTIPPNLLNGLPVTAIGNMAFYGNRNLTNVVIPPSVTRIGILAFWGCTNLTSVILSRRSTPIQIGLFAFPPKITPIYGD